MNRVWGIFLGLFLVLLAGCGLNNNNSPSASEKTIVMWHWLSDKEELLETFAKEFYEKTGIYVKTECFPPPETYIQKIMASAQTNTLPDIYSILNSKRDFANFVKAGFVLKLDSYMDANGGEWKNRFFENALKTVSFVAGNQFGIDPGVYGVPIDVINIQYLYNKDIFRKAGLDPNHPPQTIDEFINAVKKIEKAGYGGLVSGFGEPWIVECFASNFAWNIMGEEKMIATYKGEVPYTDPDWIRVFSLIERMAKEGVFVPGIVIKSNKDAEVDFAYGKVGFAFNGSWAINVYKNSNENIQVGIMLPPKVSNANPRGIWGGAGTWFAVNAKSPKKELAVKFLKWLTEKEQEITYAKETFSIPAIKGCMEAVPEEVKGFLSGMKYVYHPRNFPVQEYPLVVEAFTKGIQAIITGEKSAREVAEDIQKVKEREMKKRPR